MPKEVPMITAPFPKLQRAAKDLMLDAPSAVDEHQLRELHLSWLTKAPQDVRGNET
jgi:aspartyl-tRNA synthetase